jgi:sigma-B regulation protein RsbU (phosphoserine phosphatase)
MPPDDQGDPFDTLSKEVREYLVGLTGEESATRALRKLRSAMHRVKEMSESLTRASLERAAQQGFEIRDGEVSQPEEAGAAKEVIPGRAMLAGTDEEREQARQVQSKLLPAEVPELPGMDIATFSRFSRDVGGDYYDFIRLPRGRFGLMIADVSGKGVPAAMVMVMFRSIFRMVAANDHGAAETLIRTNQLLSRDLLREMFVSALYGVIDPQDGSFTLVNAGHYPPLLCRPRLSGTRAVNIRGPAIGLLGVERFRKLLQQKTLRIESGDTLCFYTDGITEAKNLLGEEFGYRPLARALRDCAGQSAQTIVHRLVGAVDDFQENAPQHDDITLIVLRCE